MGGNSIWYFIWSVFYCVYIPIASELHTDLVSSQIATPLVSGIVAGIQSDRLADSRNPLSTKAIRDLLQKSFSKPTKSKLSVEDKNPDLSMKINTEYRVLRSFT